MVRSEPASDGGTNADWYCLSLGDAVLAYVVKEAIKDAFNRQWQSAGTPCTWSLWLRTESGDLHCQQTLFFPPACLALAQHYQAQRTGRPSRSTLEWFAGCHELP